MMGGAGRSLVQIDWQANPFRGDAFEAAWRPAAEAALDYGAHGYAFLRATDDRTIFTQLAFFDSKLDFDRYWLSEEISDARARASGLYQVPLLPAWHEVLAMADRSAGGAPARG